MANADASDRINLGWGGSPAWSPDGEQIAFTAVGIWVMSPDGSARTQLTDDLADDPARDSPVWSPDSARIAFGRGARSRFDIWTMSGDGTDQTQLTDSPLQDGSSAWSPDGGRLAFVRGADIWLGGDLWVMNADGTAQTGLTGPIVGAPDWQPLRSAAIGPPPSQFCLGEARRNTSRGTARLVVEVPRSGRVVLQRRVGVRRFVKAYDGEGAGKVALRVRPRGKAKRRLDRAARAGRRARARIRARVTFHPEVGEARTKGRRMWLVRDGAR